MTIFISHITEEAETAKVLKSWLESIFLGHVNVFVSSKPTDIKAGEKWLSKIENSLDKSKCLLVLCSLQSINRPWINFETGAAWIKKIPIIPICHSGITKNNLPMPIAHFQGLEVDENEFSKELVQALVTHLGYSKLPKISFEDFNKEVLETIDSKNIKEVNLDDDLGLLDHIIFVDDGFKELTEVLNDISDATEEVTEEAKETQQKFEIANQDTSQGANKRRQRIARKLAKPMNEYQERLEEANSRFANILQKIEESLYYILDFEYEIDDEAAKELNSLYNSLNFVHSSALEALVTFNGMKKTLDEFPKLQRKLNKAVRNSSQEVGHFNQNLNNTLDVLHKAQTMIKSLLSRAS